MITFVLYIGSLTNLATWFPCGRGRTLFILGSLPLYRLIIYIDGRILWCTHSCLFIRTWIFMRWLLRELSFFLSSIHSKKNPYCCACIPFKNLKFLSWSRDSLFISTGVKIQTVLHTLRDHRHILLIRASNSLKFEAAGILCSLFMEVFTCLARKFYNFASHQQ